MKKKLLLALVCLISLGSHAQEYVEGFEGEFPPEGWIVTDNGIGMEKTWEKTELGDPILPPYEGNYAAYIDKEDVATGTPEDWLITPQFTVTQDYLLRFYSRLTQPGDQGSIYRIMLTTGDATDLGAYVQIQEWTELEINPVQDDYIEKVVAIPNNYVGFDVHLAFIMVGDNGDRWLIDNVSLATGCETPTNLAMEASDPTTLDISWDSDPSITEFEVAVQSVNEPFTGAGAYTVQGNYFVIDGVDENEQYLVCVRSLCPDGGTSEWACVGGEQNTLTGVVTYDADNDTNCDAENIMPFLPIEVTINNTAVYTTYTNFSGAYTIYNVSNGDEVILQPVLPSAFPEVDATNVTISLETGETVEVADICLPQPDNAVNDIEVVLLPVNNARPGFTANYLLIVKNKTANQAENVTVTLDFTEERVEVNTLDAPYTTTDSNTILITVGTIAPFTSGTVNAVFDVFEPPVNEGGDQLFYTAYAAMDAEDNDVTNNYHYLNQILVNSYDPNSVVVAEGDMIPYDANPPELPYIHYTINFQNLGTAEAVNIRVENDLDGNFDWSTFEMLTASHEYSLTRTDGHLEFQFDNINLPDSTTDEPGSHGYVMYRIKPKEDINEGDIVNNTADIYFDFNPAIVTNTATSEFYSVLLSTNMYQYKAIQLYPNPVSDILYIDTKQEIIAINVYDINGRLCVIGKESTVNVQDLKQGLYFAEVITDSGKQFYKIVKE
ncbi:hypothetical protein GCM10007424_24500 [Flavobacterium suaedae]|uniref:Fibronectin type-III domain-containing protein n=1 Tax=Flavobacterium suaedae TaxID=1767027 RepID=A0ABQ1K1E6_9FLAO|nr:choice-of-anchor J domain-containing protein [Flavobacterium suaedae]GGB83587.1 hypothetical protein GCM10007424_24500 [Flavobacterium suaedae]